MGLLHSYAKMPKRFLKTFLPDRGRLQNYKSLRFLGSRIYEPGLWHLGRRTVAGGLALGTLVAFIPVPGQMFIAALGCLWLRVNLPLAVATVWVTNPVTTPPIVYFAYRIGAWLLGSKPLNVHVELTPQWLLYNLEIVWQPFLVGSLVVGTVLSALVYVLTHLIWRCYVTLAWRRRRKTTGVNADPSRSDAPGDPS